MTEKTDQRVFEQVMSGLWSDLTKRLALAHTHERILNIRRQPLRSSYPSLHIVTERPLAGLGISAGLSETRLA